ncbi:hypothetical protein BOTNAR_0228g00150 [Botryotinia narcissicola]|uniref:Uncharacterized protein n=1 Tax=Botryotinia narcissicola TaxID=278944 RepID=A0A4Z1I4J6_9HELO|nr:hypothetical protein BOTNAR_0228g00150 [Botryotinia narcissicola]
MDSHRVLPNGLMNYRQTGSQDRHNITQDIGPINAGAGSRLFVGMNITNEAAVPKRDEILKWLDPEDRRIFQFKEHTRYCEDRADDTGEDFLNGDFKEWASSNKKFLWLRGQARENTNNCSSYLIENIPKILRITSLEVTLKNAHLVAFYYCSFSDDSTFDVNNFQSSVIAQLCENYGIVPELKRLYENCKPYPPSTIQLTALLLSIISSLKSSSATFTNSEQTEACRSITLVIDGLDEVPPVKPRDGYLNVIKTLSSIQDQNFRIVIVSREEGDLKASFSKDGWRWLMRDVTHVTLDIEKFVQARISSNSTLSSQSLDIKTLISRRISQGSKGMFRLSVLQMKELELLTRHLTEVHKEDLEFIFDSLPRDLDTFYDLIIERIPKGLLSELETVLKWLIFAARPLFVEEIVEVCTIRLSINGLPCIGIRRRALEIVENLPGLVELEPPLADGVKIVPRGVHILSIAHFSVLEYLCPTHDISRPPGLIRFTNIYKEHQTMAQACLAYLLHCFKNKDGRTAAFFLREYCWYSWSMHITAPTDSYDLKARTTADSLRLHNSIVNPILYRRRSEVVSMEAARLRSFTATFTPKMFTELLVSLEDLEFPFDDSGVSERSINSQQTPYKRILGHCPDATRLVTLYPSSDPDSPLRCGICTDSLDNNPDYVALSYAWDEYYEKMPVQKVYGNGFPLHLRPNLHSALVHLREKTEPRMLWIYAICVDMQNLEERNFQVRLMARIYSQAEEVIMWLGESRNSSNTMTSEAKAVSVLNMKNSLDVSVTPYWETWGPLDALFRRSLWSRAWMIQESVVAKKLTVMCGHCTSSFDHWHNLRELRRKRLEPEFQLTRLFSNDFSKVDDAAWDYVIALQTLRDRKHISSDYRDKLYALLGLLGDKERLDPLLTPDYSLSSADMAHKLTVYVLKKYQNLTILESSYAADNSENLSSWALDLYVLRRPISHESSDAIQQSTLQDSHDASQAYNAGGNYVEGIMEGEILEAYQAGDIEGQEFWLE